MSVEIEVFIPRGPMPTRDAWQAELDRLKLPAYLCETFDTIHDTAFVPALYLGGPGGFEFYLGPAEEFIENYPELATATHNPELYASFSTHGDTRELMSSICAAAALASLTNGYLYDPQEDEEHALRAAPEAVEQARREVNDMGAEIEAEEPDDEIGDFGEGFEKYIAARKTG